MHQTIRQRVANNCNEKRTKNTFFLTFMPFYETDSQRGDKWANAVKQGWIREMAKRNKSKCVQNQIASCCVLPNDRNLSSNVPSELLSRGLGLINLNCFSPPSRVMQIVFSSHTLLLWLNAEAKHIELWCLVRSKPYNNLPAVPHQAPGWLCMASRTMLLSSHYQPGVQQNSR